MDTELASCEGRAYQEGHCCHQAYLNRQGKYCHERERREREREREREYLAVAVGVFGGVGDAGLIVMSLHVQRQLVM